MLLAIDTSGPTLSLGLFDDDTVDSTHEEIGRGHAERLPVLLRERLDALSLDARAISRIAVVSGPGSFAGLRAGLAFGRGLGLGLGVPVVGIPLAEALSHGSERIIVALDLRRNEVWWQVFENGATGGGERLSVDAASKRLSGTPGALVGSAAAMLAERSDAERCVAPVDRDALLCNVAALAEAVCVETHPPRPLYARGADAKPPRPPVAPTARATLGQSGGN